MLSSSKEENVLVLLKYQDPFKEYDKISIVLILRCSFLGSEFHHY